jgi:hypothetical protein
MPYPIPQLTYLGHHKANEVYYYSFGLHELESLPRSHWVCLGIVNQNFDKNFFEEFILFSASNGLLEFKAQGNFGELMHDIFDEVILEYEFQEEVETDIMTTWRNNGPNDLADSFWGSFYANVLPEGVQQNQLKIICIGFDGMDYSDTLKNLLDRINEGWIPPDED